MDFQKTNDPVLNTIIKYKYHSSITIIKTKFKPESIFSFTPVQYEDIFRKTKKLNVLKTSQQSGIPTKILIENSKYFSCYFHENIIMLLFPHDLKLADVDRPDNYRPVSILSNVNMKGILKTRL